MRRLQHRLAHRLAHRLGANRGYPIVFKRDGAYYRGFLCECGEVGRVRKLGYLEALSLAREYYASWEPGPAEAKRA